MFPMDFRVQSFGRKILIPFITHACRIASAPPPPKKNAAARSSYSSDRVQIIFVRSRSIASKAPCLRRDRRTDRSSLIGEEPLDADPRHRECSECEATGPHRSGAGWDDVPQILFGKFRQRLGRSSMADLERGLLEGPNFKCLPLFLERNRVSVPYGSLIRTCTYL